MNPRDDINGLAWPRPLSFRAQCLAPLRFAIEPDGSGGAFRSGGNSVCLFA